MYKTFPTSNSTSCAYAYPSKVSLPRQFQDNNRLHFLQMIKSSVHFASCHLLCAIFFMCVGRWGFTCLYGCYWKVIFSIINDTPILSIQSTYLFRNFNSAHFHFYCYKSLRLVSFLYMYAQVVLNYAMQIESFRFSKATLPIAPEVQLA